MNEIQEKSPEDFTYFERLDEQAIADEIRGIWAWTLVYSFTGQDGRNVTGLARAGAGVH
jgi:hypothetical protein